MATSNSTHYSDQRRRAGAKACAKVLASMDTRCESAPQDETGADFIARIAAETQRVVSAIGPMPPEAEGAILALSEFAMAVFEGIVPDVQDFIPQASLTPKELTKLITKYSTSMEACFGEGAPA